MLARLAKDGRVATTWREFYVRPDASTDAITAQGRRALAESSDEWRRSGTPSTTSSRRHRYDDRVLPRREGEELVAEIRVDLAVGLLLDASEALGASTRPGGPSPRRLKCARQHGWEPLALVLGAIVPAALAARRSDAAAQKVDLVT